jgi:truncated hemoglobin YjbI
VYKRIGGALLRVDDHGVQRLRIRNQVRELRLMVRDMWLSS